MALIQLKFPPRGADSDFALFYFKFPAKFPPRGADSAQILSLSPASLFWPDGHPLGLPWKIVLCAGVYSKRPLVLVSQRLKWVNAA